MKRNLIKTVSHAICDPMPVGVVAPCWSEANVLKRGKFASATSAAKNLSKAKMCPQSPLFAIVRTKYVYKSKKTSGQCEYWRT